MFVGDYNSSEESKKFVVGINYPSYGCGRISQHISFVDQIHSKSVGQVKEYGIRAIQFVNGSEVLTNMSVMPYRIPFLADIHGSVQTLSGSGVEGVTVSFCHIDPLTGLENTNVDYCPFQKFRTDKLGLFSGEFRISDPLFNKPIEYFNVTVQKTETLLDGTILEHSFFPPFQKIELQHLSQRTISFTDNSSITIIGRIIFDPSNTNNNICPFSGVKINMIDGAGTLTTTISGTDGSFNFTVGHGEGATVFIPNFNGHEWDSYFTSTIATPALQSPSVEPTSAPSNNPIGPSSAIPSIVLTETPTSSAPSPSHYSTSPLFSSKRLRALNAYSADLPLPSVCLFGDCTKGICIKGTKCVYQNPFYGQCQLDTTTDRKSHCIANYGACFNASSTCCSYAFSCSGIPFQCNPVSGSRCRITDSPTSKPSHKPSKQPLHLPTNQPLHLPTSQPHHFPTKQPIHLPTKQPLHLPTNQPHHFPTKQPIHLPTKQPLHLPTNQPHHFPTKQPIHLPTKQPLHLPTNQPLFIPTQQPKLHPSKQPSRQPLTHPTSWPTYLPSQQPWTKPSNQPLKCPSKQPSTQPLTHPTSRPTYQPSQQRTMEETIQSAL